MDTTSLITLLANAAVTILTTVIVTRISLGKPALFSASAFKSVARKYGSLALASFGLVINVYAVVSFLTNGKPITKFYVVFTPLNVVGAVMFAFWIAGLLASRRKV